MFDGKQMESEVRNQIYGSLIVQSAVLVLIEEKH